MTTKPPTSLLRKAALSLPALLLLLPLSACTGGGTPQPPYATAVTLDRDLLLDKIKGGWAGQTIGCTYGGPTEFKYKGAMINDSTPMIWHDDYCRDIFIEDPGLYDDVYMDLTFMEVMQREGIDAPAEAFATAFATADYKLWHANQAARYNILHGIMPPASGHWRNNPHADDIDFQIEADFIGMLCPGLPQVAAGYCDRIGHIMNYGDGWYGGVYVATLYSLAYVIDDVPTIVAEALKAIPEGAKFHACIADVVGWWRQWPDDWRRCWLEVERAYAHDRGCPEGVFNAFDIDATINAAYCVIGLLYGGGDFARTIDIATRCGQDSDCNPATAAGVLGVVLGYDALPDYWKPALDRCEQMPFPYTSLSLSSVYDANLRLLADVVGAAGGTAAADGAITVEVQPPLAVALEESFQGLYPTERRVVKYDLGGQRSWQFEGCAVVLQGAVRKLADDAPDDYVAQLQVAIDGQPAIPVDMPVDYIKRKYDIYYDYSLAPGTHSLTVTWANPDSRYAIGCKDLVVYSDKPLVSTHPGAPANE